MKLSYVACAFVLILHLPPFAELGTPTSSGQTNEISVEAINQRIRARKAEELRMQEESARIAEQQRRKQERADREAASKREAAERNYASKRQAAQAAIRDLPDTPEKQQQLDEFTCIYPASATLSPEPQAVDDCMRQLLLKREQAKRDAAAAQERRAEQERKTDQERKAVEARKAEEEQRAERERRARAAAAVAAQEAAEAESRARIVSGFIGVLGLAGVIAMAILRRRQGWASVVVAVVMGFLSGFLIYFMLAFLVTGETVPLSMTFVAVTFFGGWILSMDLLLRGAVSASKVLARGLLLGTAEWLTMIPIAIYFAGGSNVSHVSAAMGGGILASLSGGFSFGMATACLIGYAFTRAAPQRGFLPEFDIALPIGKQALGLIGSLILMVGVFAPIVKVPILGGINYFQNGQGDGVIILILGSISLYLAATKSYRKLWATGLASTAVLLFTFIGFQLRMSNVKTTMNEDLKGNMFRGLAEAAVQGVQLEWGWILLVIGAVMVVLAAGIKEAQA